MKRRSGIFSHSLSILRFYGILQQKATKWSIRRGFFFFTFIVLQFVTASTYQLQFITNFNDFIIAIVYVIFSINLTIKIVIFAICEKNIIKLIEHIDADHDTSVNNKILKFVMSLLVSDLTTGFVLSVSILLLSNGQKFTIPLLYYPTSENGYYTMFLIHYFQIFGIGSLAHGKQVF
jgi:hypothetical protein